MIINFAGKFGGVQEEFEIDLILILYTQSVAKLNLDLRRMVYFRKVND